MGFEVFILGTSGMMPLPNRGLTSVLLRREGEIFLFDCGEGTQIALRRLNLRWKKISAIFISHTHADHVTGLPGILMLSSQVERDEPLYIFGPPKIKEYVYANRKILDMYINYEIIVNEIEEAGIIFKGNGFFVKNFNLIHSKPCVGYTFEEDERPGVFYPEKALKLKVPKGPLWSVLQSGKSVKALDGRMVHPKEVMGAKRKGRKFSFVTDTLFIESIAENVKDSDLLVCEGMFTSDLVESAREKKHLTAVQAATIARDGNVKRLGLIHYSPRYTEKDLKRLLEEARRVFPNTFLTRDLQGIDLPNPD